MIISYYIIYCSTSCLAYINSSSVDTACHMFVGSVVDYSSYSRVVTRLSLHKLTCVQIKHAAGASRDSGHRTLTTGPVFNSANSCPSQDHALLQSGCFFSRLNVFTKPLQRSSAMTMPDLFSTRRLFIMTIPFVLFVEAGS